MKKLLEPGKYVVAVSGGVDSAVLLHMLSNDPKLELVVAHFDHGMRSDSSEDLDFVENLAKKYGYNFISKKGNLGSNASEAAARQHRYKFLHQVRKENQAQAAVTAHHQDDAVETSVINLLRGTKQKGIVSLKTTDFISRPLLHMTKQQILDYAARNNLKWREDITNQNSKYLRNRVRKALKAGLDKNEKRKLAGHIDTLRSLDEEIGQIVDNLLGLNASQDFLKRDLFISLPNDVSLELLAVWLRNKNIQFDSKTLQRLVVGIKTKPAGSELDVTSNHYFIVGRKRVDLILQDSTEK